MCCIFFNVSSVITDRIGIFQTQIKEESWAQSRWWFWCQMDENSVRLRAAGEPGNFILHPTPWDKVTTCKRAKKDVYDSSFPSVSSCGYSDGDVCAHHPEQVLCQETSFQWRSKTSSLVFMGVRSFLFAVCLQADWMGHTFTHRIIIRTDAFLPNADAVKRLL